MGLESLGLPFPIIDLTRTFWPRLEQALLDRAHRLVVGELIGAQVVGHRARAEAKKVEGRGWPCSCSCLCSCARHRGRHRPALDEGDGEGVGEETLSERGARARARGGGGERERERGLPVASALRDAREEACVLCACP